MPKSKLLLVDDEQAFIEILAQRLRKRGFDVATIDSGQAALNRLEENSDLDVIILDLKMPGLDGIESIQSIKNKCPLIEIILLTGHGTVESAVAAIRQGAFDYLLKPYELDSLILKIQAAIRQGIGRSLRNTVMRSVLKLMSLLLDENWSEAVFYDRLFFHLPK